MSEAPFKRDVGIDQPGIIGARWWQESLTTQVSRRKVLSGMLVAGGVLGTVAVLGTCATAVFKRDPADDATVGARVALDMQREYGWNFGAETENLTFNGESTEPFDKAALSRMADDFVPSRTDNLPSYVRTLFEAPPADRRTNPPGDPNPALPFRDVLKPISTPDTRASYLRGQSLASLFIGRGADVSVIVDLPGAEAVAFAAGAAEVFDVVFAIDNWPHPRAVVPAHMTLASAAFYQPRFVAAKAKRSKTAPTMYVLDRARLTPYQDESTQFDNRHAARLPSVAKLKGAGVKHVLYVAPRDSDIELDDENEPFRFYASSGVDVKLVGADAFRAASTGGGENVYYGGSAESHESFWLEYPWAPAKKGATKLPISILGAAYAPRMRATAFDGIAVPADAPPGTRPRPANFGYVPVMIATTGVILGARYSRSGSWNRTSWGSSSGS